jgi:hypothetical protein
MNTLVEKTFDPLLFLKNFQGENFEECIQTINYGSELEFKYIDFKNIDLSNSEISPDEIFKFNMFLIVSKLSDNFSKINIKLAYNYTNRNELILKEQQFTFKNDVMITFNKEQNYFECGLDYIKKSLFVDSYKNISSHVNLDYYKYFDEDTDNLNVFMEDCIYRLLIILCSLENDEYKLAEILFIKSNSNTNLTDLKDQLEIFKKIINGKKNNFVNLKDIYEQFMPVNPDTGDDMNYEQFIKYIQDDIFIGDELDLNNNELMNWNDFELVILGLDKNISPNIKYYKIIYKQAINTLLLSLKTIIELIQQINKTKKYIPQYIQQLLEKDILNFDNKELLKNIYKQLEDYFDEKTTINLL